MIPDGLAERLHGSIAQQEHILRSSLILNPVENFPFPEDLSVTAGALHGLYNSDKIRDRDQRLETAIQFAGRQRQEADSRLISDAWASALGAADVSLRLLSGLHAHTVVFMALARPGDRILLLPVRAGGHMATAAILERLGLKVLPMVVDNRSMCIDMPATVELTRHESPDFIFVDRSEGLVYEDFSPLVGIGDCINIFDGSQYLTNILSGDHHNPFDWGFTLFLSSLHKNFPGPQKALVATRSTDGTWRSLLGQLSTFVSNFHMTNSYAAALTLSRQSWLQDYSSRMLKVAVLLEATLDRYDVPVVVRPHHLPPTHHLWICQTSKDRAYRAYEALETCRILTNFRLLPYTLGYGLRLGVNAAVRLGMVETDVPRLARLIATILRDGPSDRLRDEAATFSQELWNRANSGPAQVLRDESHA